LCTAGEDKYIKLWSIDRLTLDGNRSADMTFSLPYASSIECIAWPTWGTSWSLGNNAQRDFHTPSMNPPLPSTKLPDKKRNSVSSNSHTLAGSKSTTSNSSGIGSDGFASGSATGVIELWDLRHSKRTYRLYTVHLRLFVVPFFCFLKKSLTHICAATGSFRLGQPPISLEFFPRNCASAGGGSSATCDNYIMTATANNSIFVYDARNLATPCSSVREDGRVNSVKVENCFSNNRVFIGLENGQVRVRSANDLNCILQDIKAHVAPCSAICIDPMRRYGNRLHDNESSADAHIINAQLCKNLTFYSHTISGFLGFLLLEDWILLLFCMIC
jgi:WD40 repeat protein